MPAITEAVARELLLQVWGEQACLRPAGWPDVLSRLLKDGVASPGGSGFRRGTLAPLVEEASAALAEAVDRGPVERGTVWRAFPRLNTAHQDKLAALLNAEASA